MKYVNENHDHELIVRNPWTHFCLTVAGTDFRESKGPPWPAKHYALNWWLVRDARTRKEIFPFPESSGNKGHSERSNLKRRIIPNRKKSHSHFKLVEKFARPGIWWLKPTDNLIRSIVMSTTQLIMLQTTRILVQLNLNQLLCREAGRSIYSNFSCIS